MVKEVTREMKRLVFPLFKFGRVENATYNTDAFLELQSYLIYSHSVAMSGTNLFAKKSTREKGTPDADTRFYNFKRQIRDQIAEIVNGAIGWMTDAAKQLIH